MPERKLFKVATKVLIHNNSKFLVLKRSDYKLSRKGHLDAPGGVLEEGESPEEGIIREVLEEVGISIKDPCFTTAR